MSAAPTGPDRLRTLAARLTVPLPRKTNLLRELRDDLEALTGELIAKGLEPHEASRRAAVALVPDDITVQRLEAVHATRYRRATARIDAVRLRRIERGLMAVALAVITVAGGLMLAPVGITYDPSPFLWPVVAVGLSLVAACLAKGFELWIKGDHANPRRGLTAIVILGLSVVVLGGAGALIDTIVLFERLSIEPDRAGRLLLDGVRREATLLAVSLVLAMPGAVFWLVVHQWVAWVEDAHRRVLTTEPSPSQGANR